MTVRASKTVFLNGLRVVLGGRSPGRWEIDLGMRTGGTVQSKVGAICIVDPAWIMDDPASFESGYVPEEPDNVCELFGSTLNNR